MAEKKVSFDFALITKILVGLMLVFMGIAGFIDTRGTSFTYGLYDFLDQDAGRACVKTYRIRDDILKRLHFCFLLFEKCSCSCVLVNKNTWCPVSFTANHI